MLERWHRCMVNGRVFMAFFKSIYPISGTLRYFALADVPAGEQTPMYVSPGQVVDHLSEKQLQERLQRERRKRGML